jgi:Ran GTPase-activating protein (RanGAP) involved in mRNA processing and transport
MPLGSNGPRICIDSLLSKNAGGECGFQQGEPYPWNKLRGKLGSYNSNTLYISFKNKEEFLEFLSHPAAIGLKKLKFSFNFAANTLTAEDWLNLKNLSSSLVWLDLYGVILRDAGAQAIAGALEHTPRLTTLNIGYNSISATGAQAIAGALAHTPQLTVLHVGLNHIGAEGVQAIAGVLEHTPQLTKLIIWGNRIGPEVEVALQAARNAHNPKLSIMH